MLLRPRIILDSPHGPHKGQVYIASTGPVQTLPNVLTRFDFTRVSLSWAGIDPESAEVGLLLAR